MSAIASTPTDADAKNATMSARPFFLDLSAGRILSANLMLRFEDHHHRRPEVARLPGARCRRQARLLGQSKCSARPDV